MNTGLRAVPGYGVRVGGYFWIALVAALIVLAGFAPSYYLRPLSGAPSLPLLLHAHGAIMSLWFAFFIVQTRLVAIHRVDWHRRLGIAGAVLALLVVITGVMTAVNLARGGQAPAGVAAPVLMFLIHPLGLTLTFAALIATGLLLRRRREVHRRLMLLATLSLLPPAFARGVLKLTDAGLVGITPGMPVILSAMMLTNLLILGVIAADTARHRRLHPAFIYGFVWIAGLQVLRLQLADTPLWLGFAAWIVQ